MDPKQVIRAFVDAHNAHDIDGMMDFLADGCVMIDVAAPIPLNNKNDVRKLYEMVFGAVSVNFEITGMISEGNRVFAALRTTGTGTGDWLGRDIRGAECDVFEGMFCEVQDGKISKAQFYSDTATLSKQLGGYAPAIDMKASVKHVM